ncbi:MAG TPA: tetratricopeptide repeat protein [Terriglobia bacterium]|nr:tetratricopeptide repeat protein [Terriglobia bacterium]
MAHVIWEYRNVGQNTSAARFHLHKLRVLGRKPCSTRVACAVLAFWLFLSVGGKLLNAQNSLARQHASKADQLVRTGDLKGAEAEMRQAVELSPKNPEYLMRVGLILTMQERPKVAAIFFERALKLDPVNLTLRRHLAGSQWQGGRLDASQENLEVILKANPRDSEALLMLGMVLMDAGRFPAAHSVAQRATQVMPSSDQAYAVKGMAEMRMQRYTEAAKSYKQAVELNPKTPDVNLGLAMSLWAAGDITESFAIFEQGLKRFPEDAYHCLEYGRLLLKSAKPDDSTAETRAIALLQNALTLNRSLPEAHYWLGDLALRRGNPEKALEHLEQAVKLDPGSSKIHFALSRTHRRLGRMDDAAREEDVFQKLKAREEAAPAAPLLAGGLG